MRMRHQYELEPYNGIKSRYRCPSCNNRQRTFARYVDTRAGEYISPDVGKCDRENNCGYHYTPKQYFQDNPNPSKTTTNPNIFHARARTVAETAERSPSFIPYSIFQASLKDYERNCFVQYLKGIFSIDVVNQLIDRYLIGSCKHWSGGTVFWQIDTDGNIRSGKLMLYNPNTGKRVKEPYKHINWVHALKDRDEKPIFPDFNLRQCFFGEHLLKSDQTKIVAIVESEKTAVIASVYFPDCIWLASCSMQGISVDKLKILEKRNVILYPDLNCYKQWYQIAERLPNVHVSKLLENRATDKEKADGLDIADYLLKYDYQAFISQSDNSQKPEKTCQTLTNPYIENTFAQPEEVSSPTIAACNSCFEGKTGKVYVQNPTAHNRYAVYTSVNCYNNRSEIPEYISSFVALEDFKRVLVIDYACLMIK